MREIIAMVLAGAGAIALTCGAHVARSAEPAPRRFALGMEVTINGAAERLTVDTGLTQWDCIGLASRARSVVILAAPDLSIGARLECRPERH